MLVSFNWLKEFVEIEHSAQEMAELLTMGGSEVEALSRVGTGLDKILTARIEDIKPHPDAERLSLARIGLGSREETVVCGAPNIRVGQVVPYAPPGAVLPSGLEMTEREIKGIRSPGMLCSEKELDLGEDESGILVFNDSVKIGLELNVACPYIEDFILEIGITPNRGDCLSILGIAREVAALTDKPVKIPSLEIVEGSINVADKITVEVPDKELCPRYVVRMVEGVKIGPSPFDVRLKLTRSGVRPISNVVDVTNLVLLECGQPLHAFDYDLLEDHKIIVRRADPGESFVTLDQEERKLPECALMIRDGKRSVGLAGIMGGLNSEIEDATSNVLIESACFERFGIRRTAKSLGLSTEASFRFERGVDPEGTFWAANRSADLIAKLAGGTVLASVVDVYPVPIERPPVAVRPPRVNKVLGTKVKHKDMAYYLRRLGIDVNDSHRNEFVCTPPSWRWDLEIEEDFVEEVARIYGYQNIPATLPVYGSAPDRTRRQYDSIRKVAQLMTSSGFSEVITMSFVTAASATEFLTTEDTTGLALLNPLTEDQAVMRTSLIPGLIACMTRNVSFRSTDLKLFEVGKTFTPVKGEELPREDVKLAGLLTGNRHADLWNVPREEHTDFYDMKGAVENLLEGFGIGSVQFLKKEIPFLHPGKSAEILINTEPIGYVGELSPAEIRDHDLDAPVQIFEIFVEPLLVQGRKQRVFRPIPRYPYIERDLSIIIEENVSGDEIKHLISRLGHDIIATVTVFDLYRGKGIPEGKQSIAFRIRYQSEDRTLTDEEVEEVHSQVVETIIAETGATMRE